jgi:cyclopropane fatty-acyl-phospholipid synthase-like methyltransferase
MAEAPPEHGSEAPRSLEDLYTSPPAWDIGRPQPAFLALATAGAVLGRVLDVGCGTGEHALMAAALGLDATGVDLAANALRIAEDKGLDRGLPVRFLRHDSLRLADLGETFDTVLDSLVFHIFKDDDRAAYVDGLRSVLKSGGRYFMLCFSDRQPGDLGRPHKLTQEEIRAAFANGWQVDSIEPATIASTRHPDGMQGWLSALTRI